MFHVDGLTEIRTDGRTDRRTDRPTNMTKLIVAFVLFLRTHLKAFGRLFISRKQG